MSALASSNRLDARMEASWPEVDGRIDGGWGADGCTIKAELPSDRAVIE